MFQQFKLFEIFATSEGLNTMLPWPHTQIFKIIVRM